MKNRYHVALLYPSSNKWDSSKFRSVEIDANYIIINDGSVDFYGGKVSDAYSFRMENLIASYPRQYTIIEKVECIEE